ncbi:MAG: ABC-type transport auxiliary lipoprotein family protein [Rhodanobacteraceae bacterium]|nr:ABC-type transport auxiliary lipoprotein family protein [Pseudomonadota bacterium]
MVLAMAGCGILPPNESPSIYVLPQSTAASQNSDANAQPLPWQLRVDTPEATGMLDNAGIVVMPEPGRITLYKGARWSDNAPVLLRQRLVDAFLASHRLPAVTSEEDSLHSDYVLGGDLRAFQSEYRNGAPVVVLRYDAQLRRGGSRRIFAAHSFEVTQNPTGVAVPQVVQAFGAACDQLDAQVVAWTLSEAQRDWQTQTPAAQSRGTSD